MRDKNLKLTTKQRNKGICKHLTEHYFENFCFPVGPFLIIIHTIPKKSPKKHTKMKYLLTYFQCKLFINSHRMHRRVSQRSIFWAPSSMQYLWHRSWLNININTHYLHLEYLHQDEFAIVLFLSDIGYTFNILHDRQSHNQCTRSKRSRATSRHLATIPSHGDWTRDL